MLKLKILIVVILILFLNSSQSSGPLLDTPDRNGYLYIGNFEGVKAYWKTKYNSYSQGYGIVYKLENTTSNCLRVKYRASFKCGDEKGEDDWGSVFIQRHSAKEGELGDLYSYSYPCPSGIRPTRIDLQVEVVPK